MKHIDWFNSLQGRGWNLGLERISELLSRLKNPHLGLKCIHVAGTNGKGSVCAMLASILEKQGYKVGLYTSPHLKRFTERIQINRIEISETKVDELLEKIKPHCSDQTYFEVLTALAFLYSKEEECDFSVIEVGLGGRLDATNVITPLLSIITNISWEHTEHLGDTIEKIAYEKAGIIKNGKPVITLAEKEALKVIRKIAKEKNSRVYIPKKYYHKNFSLNSYKNLRLNLKGNFQLQNASLALEAIDLLREQGYDISEAAIREGLGKIKWQGRFEFIARNVLVDCAHNPAGIAVLKAEIDKIRDKYEKVISVVGILKDKDKKTMVELISKFSDYILFSRPQTERVSEPEELSSYTLLPNEIVYNVRNAMKKAKKLANPQDLIVVTGSIYTVAEVL